MRVGLRGRWGGDFSAGTVLFDTRRENGWFRGRALRFDWSISNSKRDFCAAMGFERVGGGLRARKVKRGGLRAFDFVKVCANSDTGFRIQTKESHRRAIQWFHISHDVNVMELSGTVRNLERPIEYNGD